MFTFTTEALHKVSPRTLTLKHGRNVRRDRARAALAVREGEPFAGSSINGSTVVPIIIAGDWQTSRVQEWLRANADAFDYVIRSYRTGMAYRMSGDVMVSGTNVITHPEWGYGRFEVSADLAFSSVQDNDGYLWITLNRAHLVEWSNTTAQHVGQIHSIIRSLSDITRERANVQRDQDTDGAV